MNVHVWLRRFIGYLLVRPETSFRAQRRRGERTSRFHHCAAGAKSFPYLETLSFINERSGRGALCHPLAENLREYPVSLLDLIIQTVFHDVTSHATLGAGAAALGVRGSLTKLSVPT